MLCDLHVPDQLPYPKKNLPPGSANSLRALFIPIYEATVMERHGRRLQSFVAQRILWKVGPDYRTCRIAGEEYLFIQGIVLQRTCCLESLRR
jgi:hypothetical protein